ncbi:MAG: hypothetical protein RI923_531 [Pseudomonadota bacterium]
MIANGTQRVVVLGREGQAREQLVSALTDLGVHPVWVGKPAQTSVDALSQLAPNILVISLDPATELELEPYSEFLRQPSLTVLFDDAETTGALSGWDLNRWARHMAAKLLDRDVLPPLPMDADAKSTIHGQDDGLPDYRPIGGSHENIPVASGFAAPKALDESVHWQDAGHYDDLAIDADALALALSKVDSELAHGHEGEAVKVDCEQLLPLTDEERALLDSGQEVHNDDLPSIEKLDIGHSGSTEWHDGDGFSFDLDDSELAGALQQMEESLAHPAPPAAESDEEGLAPLTEAEKSMFNYDIDTTLMPDFAVPEMKAAVTASVQEPVIAPDFSSLALSVDAAMATPVAAAVASVPPREFDLSMFSLVDDAPAPDTATALSDAVPLALAKTSVEPAVTAEPANDAIRAETADHDRLFLVVSGVGGPGAVRTLLQKVPRGFAGVMVLSLQIGAAQLERLRAQLQKVTDADLRVADSDEHLRSGSIYLLPPECGIAVSALGYQCQPRTGLRAFITLQSKMTRILVLSGADPALTSALIAFSAGCKNLYVQDPEECYDAGVARELANAGAPHLTEDTMVKWFN